MIAAIPPSKPATAAINPATTPNNASGCSRQCLATHRADRRSGGKCPYTRNVVLSLGIGCSSQCFSFQRFNQPMPVPTVLLKALSIADRGLASPKRKEVAHG